MTSPSDTLLFSLPLDDRTVAVIGLILGIVGVVATIWAAKRACQRPRTLSSQGARWWSARGVRRKASAFNEPSPRPTSNQSHLRPTTRPEHRKTP